MEERFNLEEIQKLIQAAHIAAPDIREEDLEKLLRGEEYLGQPLFAETFWVLTELQKKKGVSISYAL